MHKKGCCWDSKGGRKAIDCPEVLACTDVLSISTWVHLTQVTTWIVVKLNISRYALHLPHIPT